MRLGILAGVLGGRRRVGLGPTWDSRYHRYLDPCGCGQWRYRPALRLAAPASDERVDAPVEAEPLRKAS